jgi:hypothetical protein
MLGPAGLSGSMGEEPAELTGLLIISPYGKWLWDGYGYESIPMKIPFLEGWTSILTQIFWCEQKGYKVLTHCHINQNQKITTFQIISLYSCVFFGFRIFFGVSRGIKKNQSNANHQRRRGGFCRGWREAPWLTCATTEFIIVFPMK